MTTDDDFIVDGTGPSEDSTLESVFDPDDLDGLLPIGDIIEGIGAKRAQAAKETAEEILTKRVMKTLPHDALAERQVVGQCLVTPIAVEHALAEGLEPAHFYVPQIAVVFSSIIRLHESKAPIDSTSVVDDLLKHGQLTDAGGATGVAQIEAAVLFRGVGVASYAHRIIAAATKRRVIEVAQITVAAVVAAKESPAVIIEDTKALLERVTTSVIGKGFAAEIRRAKYDLALSSAGVTSARDRPLGKSLLDLASTHIGPVPWVIKGILRERAVFVMGAAPKQGKTWDEIEMAISISSGTSLFGQFPCEQQGSVLMNFLEDDERDLWIRSRALARGRGQSMPDAMKNIFYESRPHIDLLSDDDCAWIVASARRIPNLILLTIDPFRDANSGEENSNDDMRLVMGRLRKIRDILGCAVMLVHHLTKPQKEQTAKLVGSIFDRFRGAGAIRGAWDGAMGKDTLSKVPGCLKSRMEVELRGGRDAGTFGLRLDIEDDASGNAHSARYTYFGDVDALKETMAPAEKKREDDIGKVMDVLKDEAARAAIDKRPPEPFSVRYIEARTGLKRNKVADCLKQLESAGLTRKTTMGTVWDPIAGATTPPAPSATATTGSTSGSTSGSGGTAPTDHSDDDDSDVSDDSDEGDDEQ